MLSDVLDAPIADLEDRDLRVRLNEIPAQQVADTIDGLHRPADGVVELSIQLRAVPARDALPPTVVKQQPMDQIVPRLNQAAVLSLEMFWSLGSTAFAFEPSVLRSRAGLPSST